MTSSRTVASASALRIPGSSSPISSDMIASGITTAAGRSGATRYARQSRRVRRSDSSLRRTHRDEAVADQRRVGGDHRFDAGRPNGPTARIDGEGDTGQSPPETLLTALATCVAYDVIDILAKQRTPLESLQIDVVGERVDTIPRRYKHVTLNFRISGKGIEKEQALKAIELSTNRYCSVRESLRP